MPLLAIKIPKKQAEVTLDIDNAGSKLRLRLTIFQKSDFTGRLGQNIWAAIATTCQTSKLKCKNAHTAIPLLAPGKNVKVRTF
jgi:hypothetical protein